jgi:hypothetical protein
MSNLAAMFQAGTKKRKAQNQSMLTEAGPRRHPIFAKKKGWQTTVVEALCFQLPGDALFDKNVPTLLQPNRMVKHNRWRCNLTDPVTGQTCGKASEMQADKAVTNAFNHMASKHFDGDADALLKAYADAEELKSSKGGKMADHVFVEFATKKELAMTEWVDLIVMENLSLSSVESSRFRQFSRHTDVFGHHMLRETLLQLQSLVMDRVSEEMLEAEIGAVMHDGWTYNRIHFLGIIAS